jgi:hypothetical protein
VAGLDRLVVGERGKLLGEREMRGERFSASALLRCCERPSRATTVRPVGTCTALSVLF